jgi:phosphoacetylglucosamine mutase
MTAEMAVSERRIPALPATTPLVSHPVPYGTAGFRSIAANHRMDGVAFCCGLVAALRALERALKPSETARADAKTSENEQARLSHPVCDVATIDLTNERQSIAIGVMITASHNPPEDNGVKLIDFDGGMLDPSWETYANYLVQHAFHSEALECALLQLEQQLLGPLDLLQSCQCVPLVMIAYDTRSTSPELAGLVMQGARFVLVNELRAAGRLDLLDDDSNNTILLGMGTTPALHSVVWHWNRRQQSPLSPDKYGSCSRPQQRAQYLFDNYGPSLVEAASLLLKALGTKTAPARPPLDWFVDCAHGAGALVLRDLALSLRNQTGIHLVCFNDNAADTKHLNRNCGADWVQKTKMLPDGWSLELQKETFIGGASLDGDADRLVCFFTDLQGHCTLLDGDLMASLILDFIVSCLCGYWQTHPIGGYIDHPAKRRRPHWRVALVHTAYANGAAVAYWHRRRKELEIDAPQLAARVELDIICTLTGVKHLEREARRFDIGLYFEPNGHGTVLFKDSTWSVSESPLPLPLQCCARLANQAVGDGIANLLIIASLLQWKGWSLANWMSAFYTPLPSLYRALPVPDRHVLRTADFDQQVIHPPALAACIRQILENYRRHHDENERLSTGAEKARVVVRPSGTEDIIRIYVEATTKEDTHKLAEDVSKALREHLGTTRCAATPTDAS